MNTTTIEVATPRGTMPVHLHRPDGDGPFPLVVMYMDSFGIRPTLHEHAERLAAAGYAVALPDLFYNIAQADLPDLEGLKAGDPAQFAKMGALVASISDETIMEDTRLMVAALPGDESAAWGCVGFCMGGRFSVRAAEVFGEDVAAASQLHPSRLVTDAPDSPHLGLDGVSADLYFGFGETDHVTPISTIAPLREQLQQHGVKHRIEVLPDADHGFTMPGGPAYNEAAAEQAWAGTLAVLGGRLHP